MSIKVVKVANTSKRSLELSEEMIDFIGAMGGPFAGKMSLSSHENCKRFFFAELPVGYKSKLDFSPRRQIVVVLSGQLLTHVNEKETFELSAGGVVRLEDTDYDNPARRTEVVGNAPVRLLVLQIE